MNKAKRQRNVKDFFSPLFSSQCDLLIKMTEVLGVDKTLKDARILLAGVTLLCFSLRGIYNKA